MGLIETFQSLSSESVTEYVSGGRQEDLHLEFKTVKSGSFRSSDDKRNLARAISGFANSDGGIIVWGVDARKGGDGVDRAQREDPIVGLAEMRGRLEELTGEATLPRVDGVEHTVLPITEDTGFCATVVPVSERPPHMAKLGEDRYFKRSGDSFYRMEHFDLDDMFGRRPSPDLRLVLLPDRRAPNGQAPADLIVLARLVNQGRGAAVAPYVHLKPPGHWVLCTRYSFVKWSRMEYFQWNRDDPGRLRFSGGQDAVIQPGVGRDVFQLQIREDRFSASQESLTVDYEVGSMYSTMTPHRTELGLSDISSIVRM